MSPDDTRPPSAPLGALAVGVLLLAPAVDELCSAAPTVGAPDLRDDLALSVTGLFLFATVVPVVASMVFEPAVIRLSDGPWRRRVLLGAGAAWSGGYFACAVAPSAWNLAAALSMTYIAGGVALGVARASLVAGSADIERALARWTLTASIGDLAGPLAIAGIAWAGGGWRAGMLGCGVAVGAWWIATCAAPVGHADDDDHEDERTPLTAALRDRQLMGWLLAVALCTLLDEIFVVGIALYGTDVLGLELAAAGLLVACEMIGSVCGLVLFERVGAPPRALIPACALTLAALLTAVLAPTPWLAGAALFFCGVGNGPQYPLALAAAHRARPGRPGQVEALQQVFVGLDLALPLAFGLLADRYGLAVGLAALAAQPLGIAAIAVWMSRRGPTSR